MQRLANMANRVWGAMVFVQKAAAAREIEQRQAQQQSANLPQSHSARVFARRHRISLHYHTSLDAPL
jgi:chorismate-pyruvate lyase